MLIYEIISYTAEAYYRTSKTVITNEQLTISLIEQLPVVTGQHLHSPSV